MLISRRRFYWAIVVTLLFATFAMVRPMRTWVDRGLVSTVTDGSVAVDQLHLHLADSVVEAQGLTIDRVEQGRQFGMRAGKTWIAIDGVGLMDRRCAAPTVLVEDAVLYLSKVDTSPSMPPTAWHDTLAKRLSGITWTELQKHFDSVFAADQITRRWDEKLASWVKRSEQLLGRLSEIESESIDTDNPLRHEGDVLDRLRRIEALQAEQIELAKQFTAARRMLEAEAQQLRDKFETEKEAFKTAAIDADINGMADEILSLSGRDAWQQLAAYCEVAARMASIRVGDAGPPWNRDFRYSREPLVELPVIKVAGVFERDSKPNVPFSVKGAFVSPDGVTIEQAKWDYSFFEIERVVELGVDVEDERSQLISINVHSDRSDLTDDQSISRGDIAINDGQLSGKIRVFAPALATRANGNSQSGAREQQILAAGLARQGPGACVVFDISGSWQSPQLTASQPAQQWLIDQIHDSIRPNLQNAIAEATDKLESELQERLSQLSRTSQVAANGASSLSDEQSNPLYAARNRLQASLDEISAASIRR